MDNNNMNTQFTDKAYKKLDAQGLITEKLQQIDEFEANFRPNTASKSMYRWCTDYEYRKNEWQFRQNVAKSLQYGI